MAPKKIVNTIGDGFIRDILFVRFRVPDLEAQQQFLQDFGLAVERFDTLLLARGTDSSPYIYIAEQGDPAFLGFGIEATEHSALEVLAELDGVPIEENNLSGGGKVVRLTDPNGFAVDVVHGFEPADTLPTQHRPPLNDSEHRPRLDERVTADFSGPYIKRLGHCVLMVKDFRESEAWYKTRFGFITSDEITAPDNSTIGAFLRCNRGETFVDHHTLFLVHAGRADFNHAAFEVSNWDVLMKSHYDLQRAGYKHSYGVGKHILGSQVFDYWKDQNGFMVEHFTDGDLFNEASGSHTKTHADLMGTLWGPDGAPGA